MTQKNIMDTAWLTDWTFCQMIKALVALNLVITASIAVHLQLQISAIESDINHSDFADNNSPEINHRVGGRDIRGQTLSADLYVGSGLDNLMARSNNIGRGQPLSVKDAVREQYRSDVKFVSPEDTTSDIYSGGKKSIGPALSPDDVNAFYDVSFKPRESGQKLSADFPYANY